MIFSFRKYVLLSHWYMRLDFSSANKLLVPSFFTLSILLLLRFCFFEIDHVEYGSTVFVAEVLVSLFLTLQVAFSASMSSDWQDGTLRQLVASPIPSEVIFAAKLTSLLVLTLPISTAVLLFSWLFHGGFFSGFYLFSIWGLMFFISMFLATLGITLLTLMGKNLQNQFLFAILYFPLSVPILLASVKLMKNLIQFGHFAGLAHWVGAMICFGIINLTIGVLLYEDLLSN